MLHAAHIALLAAAVIASSAFAEVITTFTPQPYRFAQAKQDSNNLTVDLLNIKHRDNQPRSRMKLCVLKKTESGGLLKVDFFSKSRKEDHGEEHMGLVFNKADLPLRDGWDKTVKNEYVDETYSYDGRTLIFKGKNLSGGELIHFEAQISRDLTQFYSAHYTSEMGSAAEIDCGPPQG